MSEAPDDALERFEIRAQSAWSVLQTGIWGARWDFTEPCLDFSRASLVRLSDWLMIAARGEAALPLKDVLAAAGQYFGETILEHARARWVRRQDKRIGIQVERGDGEALFVDIPEVLEAWRAAVYERQGREREVFVAWFDRVIEGALPPRTRSR
jgi:hypothetical protein